VVAVTSRRRAIRKIARALSIAQRHDHERLPEGSLRGLGVKAFRTARSSAADGKIINVHRGYSEDALDSIIAEINEALASK